MNTKTKTIRNSDDIVKSLIAYRDKLYAERKGTQITDRNDPFLIINEILYRGDAFLTR